MFKNKLTATLLFLAVAILLIFLTKTDFFSKTIDVLLKPIRPIQARVHKTTAGINDFINNVFLASQLDIKIKELSETVVSLSKENVHTKDLETENASLRNLLQFKETQKKQKLTLTRVLGKSPFESTVIILDKGSLNNIQIGQAVITENGILLGKIIKVDAFTSQLMLLSDTRSEVSASLSKTNQQAGIVAGEKGLSLKIQLVPNDQDIKVGDLVVTSGLEPEIPYGLIIGQVESIEKIPNQLFQQGIVKTIVPINSVVLAAVISK